MRGSLRLLSSSLCMCNQRPLVLQSPPSDLNEQMNKQRILWQLYSQILCETSQLINIYVNNKFKIFQVVAFKNSLCFESKTFYI